MKKYEYVRIDVDLFFGAEISEHREIIDKYAAMGYTYKGYIPTSIGNNTAILAIDLIFEIDTDDIKR